MKTVQKVTSKEKNSYKKPISELISSRLKLGTYKFVKSTGRHLYWKALADEISYLTDRNTGFLKKSFQEKSACFICRRAPSKIIFQKNCFQFHRCLKCGLIFTNPRLNEERLEKSYRGHLSNDLVVDVLLSKPQMAYDKVKYAARLEILEKLTPGRRILDIGCSIGHFLKIARERGWDSHGLELSAKAHAIATKRFGLDVQQKTLEEANFEKESFDVITFWSVLEHIPNPKKILTQVSRLLKPKTGVLLIYCPNAGSLAARILQSRARIFNGRDHLWYFTDSTLQKLLDRCSFEVIRRETEVPEFDTVMNFLNYNDPYQSNGGRFDDFDFLPNIQHRVPFSDEILRRGWGYKIIFFARKKN